MKRRIIIASGLFMLGVVVFVSSNGCGGDDDAAPRVSRKGEACQVTGDCAGGLSCVPIPGGAGGICVTGEFHIAVTAKECALIDCTQPSDCCNVSTPAATCAAYLAQCADAGVGSAACTIYDQLCKCDTAKIDCAESRCVTRCGTDTDCAKAGNPSQAKCSGGKCVSCTSDTDCSNGFNCINGACTAPCQGDGDCAGFNRCVSGKCVDSGCQTDRECVASTRNVEATCGTDGKCIVPCQTDLECGNPKAYTFFSCINAQCVYTGCQTDKDCRLLLTGPSDAGTLGPKQHVVCRDKATPGTTTKPAQ